VESGRPFSFGGLDLVNRYPGLTRRPAPFPMALRKRGAADAAVLFLAADHFFHARQTLGRSLPAGMRLALYRRTVFFQDNREALPDSYERCIALVYGRPGSRSYPATARPLTLLQATAGRCLRRPASQERLPFAAFRQVAVQRSSVRRRASATSAIRLGEREPAGGPTKRD
jgi:hypothetical protein